MDQELARIQAFINELGPEDKLSFCARIQGIQRKARTEAHHALGAVNYGKRYTKADRELMMTLTASGYNKYEIAEQLFRTVIGSTQQRQKVLVQEGETTTSLPVRFPEIAETAFEMLAPQHNNLDV